MEYDLTSKRDSALTLFGQGYNCAQAVVGACAPEYGISKDEALRLAAALGGGLAGTHRETCGALVGGLMTVGASVQNDGPEGKKAANARGKKLLAAFEARNADVHCADLLRQSDIKEKSSADPRLQGFPDIRPCARFVADVVEMLHEITHDGE